MFLRPSPSPRPARPRPAALRAVAARLQAAGSAVGDVLDEMLAPAPEQERERHPHDLPLARPVRPGRAGSVPGPAYVCVTPLARARRRSPLRPAGRPTARSAHNENRAPR
jgi:hypothetical protein